MWASFLVEHVFVNSFKMEQGQYYALRQGINPGVSHASCTGVLLLTSAGSCSAPCLFTTFVYTAVRVFVNTA